MQTQLFHSRRQGPKESVDDFAQELRRLHSKAYEAKAKELAEVKTSAPKKFVSASVPTLATTSSSQTGTFTPVTTSVAVTAPKEESRKIPTRKCYNCGMEGHVARRLVGERREESRE